MNVMLWAVQALLAVIFAASGSAKLVMSKQRMIATGQTGVAPFPLPIIRGTAFCELLAAIGLILPAWTGIAPGLTAAAAAGLIVVMIGAAASHRSLHEYPQVVLNVVLAGLCVLVLVGRM